MIHRRVDLIGLVSIAGIALCSACGPRLNVITGTTIGLKASPGDGKSSLPQVTIAYKRSEVVLLPTKGVAAGSNPTSDAYSAFGTFFLSTKFFGDTTLESFISTGHAAQNLAQPNSQFQQAFATQTMSVVSKDIQDRKLALNTKAAALTDQQATQLLTQLGYSPGDQPAATLRDVISRTQTDAQVATFETAFGQIGNHN